MDKQSMAILAKFRVACEDDLVCPSPTLLPDPAPNSSEEKKVAVVLEGLDIRH
jgi:hypothetical protein